MNKKELEKIYRTEDIESQSLRYENLIQKFLSVYGEGEYRLARAPGRVNLIGEHTDYNHCPVLPCAVDRDIIAVFRATSQKEVQVKDFVDSFGEREFGLSSPIPPFKGGNWGNYIKAAWQGLGDEGVLDLEEAKGLQMMIHSTIPSAAGMSSSSALVVLSAICALDVNGKEIPALELADMMAKAERYTGTQGGGMDQAAILLGEKGKALKIDFAPLRCERTPFPEDYKLLVAHSTIQAPKTKEVMDKYNRRSIECRLSAALIGKGAYLGELNPDHPIPLHTKGYTKVELASELNIEIDNLNQQYCQRKDGSIFEEPEDGFLVQKRAFHVLSEWKRVEESAGLLKKGKIAELGQLMYASHESCRDNHEISCRELDELVNAGKSMDGPGCRLTGAGFGGCTVHLVQSEKLDSYKQGLIEKFYTQKGIEDPDTYLFQVYPSEGARILGKE